MDTIIYFYRWKKPDIVRQQNIQREQEIYCREEFVLPDYHLLKVGMSEHLLQICQDNCVMESGRRTFETGGFFARRRRRKQLQQESILFTAFLQEITAGQENYSFVCEEVIPYFSGLCFNEYFEEKWVRHMLLYGGYIPLPHFVILGQTYCVSEMISDLVHGMKSLKWILPERQFRAEQQELVDILYEEYGLAVEVRLFSEEESYKQVHPVCRVPSVILDFSEADRIPTVDVARGSIWLDMASSEEKRRRIEDRDTGISYFSLKKEWKQPQKALNHLDTIGKNGYNT